MERGEISAEALEGTQAADPRRPAGDVLEDGDDTASRRVQGRARAENDRAPVEKGEADVDAPFRRERREERVAEPARVIRRERAFRKRRASGRRPERGGEREEKEGGSGPHAVRSVILPVSGCQRAGPEAVGSASGLRM